MTRQTASIIKTSLVTLALLSTAAISTPGFATDAKPHDGFVIATTADGNVRAGVNAFKQGDYAKSAAFQKQALKANMRAKKAAIAQSNLCAALGAMGDLDAAREACATALSLRPDYAPAMANQSALSVKLAAREGVTAGGQ